MNFKQLEINPFILESLDKRGFEQLTPVQQEVIPFLLEKMQNIMVQAQTGTGKTAAFGIPLLQELSQQTESRSVKSLILLPTRELAIQVSRELNSFKGQLNLDLATIYGGQSINLQIRHFRHKVDIIIGTPGRVKDLLDRKIFSLKDVSYLVLDEADEMLNMGFLEDIEYIISHTHKDRSIFLFSATLPHHIKKIAKKYMEHYHNVSLSHENLATQLTQQIYFEVQESNKLEALCRFIDMEDDFYGVIFTRTKVEAEQLSSRLKERTYDVAFLHGDLSQVVREQILNRFRRKDLNILVATDLMARGIDIQDMKHVINYSLPQEASFYIHRIGRTGRAGQMGKAVTFATPEEYRRLKYIQKVTNINIEKFSLPSVQNLVDKKMNKIEEKIIQNLEKPISAGIYQLMERLNQKYPDRTLLEGILSLFFSQDLDTNAYPSIEYDSRKKKNLTRFFVNQGRQNKFNPQQLLNFLGDTVHIPRKEIKNIEILKNFSFFRTDNSFSHKILDYFRKNKHKSRFIVQKANEKNTRKD